MSLGSHYNVILAALLVATVVLAEVMHITAFAFVIGGGTKEIHVQPIRLFGIDAPESSRLCVLPCEFERLWNWRRHEQDR